MANSPYDSSYLDDLCDPAIVEFHRQVHAREDAVLSRKEILDAIADREGVELAQGLHGAMRSFALETPARDPAELVKLISGESYSAIVTWETGGKRYYEQVIGAKPHWPGGQSGVTIGCGYDLGYHTESELKRDWQVHLSDSEMLRLKRALGLKGQSARSFRARVDDIRIAWGMALAVFDATTLPKYTAITFAHLPNLVTLADAGLHGHCIGTLVSLVFNRGASFRRQGDRYREMRAIREAVEAGSRRDLGTIPDHLRAMKRIWAANGPRGLLTRRENEAQLFEDGLAAMPIDEAARSSRSFSLGAVAQDPDAPAVFDALEARSEDERDEMLYEPGSGEDIVAPDAPVFFDVRPRRFEQSDVRWVTSDRNAPDYRHLPPDARGSTFDFTTEEMERLIAANRFQPHVGTHGKILFGLRGCQLIGSGHAQESQGSLRLKDVRPNHRDFRCVIGVYDRKAKTLSGYTASTVPNARGVLRYYNLVNHLGSGVKSNLLPTGCYELCVGTHFGSVTVPGVFRLGNGPMPANSGEATVLRTVNDVTFGTMDVWDRNKPSDNLHPAFGTSRFSSLGCMTVRGSYRGNGQHTGEWAKFRAAAGLNDGIGQGTRFDIVLLTGLDAATAALMRASGSSDDEIDEAIVGLRHGSQGDEVRALQRKLGLTADGDFGPGTKQALAKAQLDQLEFATGIHSVETDEDMGFEVFGNPLI